MKLLYVDTESTGFDAKVNGITEIGVIIEIDDVVKETVLFKMCPTGRKASAQALEITGYTRAMISELTPWEYMIHAVIALLDKYNAKQEPFVLVGQNLPFDIRMMDNYFTTMGFDLYDYVDQNTKIDTLPLAKKMQAEGIIPKLPNNKLITLCEYFEVSLKNAHSALGDIAATRELYLAMEKILLDREDNK